MSSYQWMIASFYVIISAANIVSAVAIFRFVNDNSPMIKDMRRSLAILRAEILINRRMRAREKIGGKDEVRAFAQADFEELKEKEL